MIRRDAAHSAHPLGPPRRLSPDPLEHPPDHRSRPSRPTAGTAASTCCTHSPVVFAGPCSPAPRTPQSRSWDDPEQAREPAGPRSSPTRRADRRAARRATTPRHDRPTIGGASSTAAAASVTNPSRECVRLRTVLTSSGRRHAGAPRTGERKPRRSTATRAQAAPAPRPSPQPPPTPSRRCGAACADAPPARAPPAPTATGTACARARPSSARPTAHPTSSRTRNRRRPPRAQASRSRRR